MHEWVEPLRIALSFSFLAASSWYDFKTREVPNRLWALSAPSGFTLSFLQFYLNGGNSFLTLWITSFLVTTGLSLALFYLGFFGGADAKALICLSIALPVYPSLSNPNYNILIIFFPLAVLSNATLGSSMLIFVMGASNLLRLIRTRGKIFEGLEKESCWSKIIAFMIGLKVDWNKLKSGSHYMPLEYFSRSEDGRVTRHLRISIRLSDEMSQVNDNMDDFYEEINGKIWATPGLPFMIFVTAGFVVALLAGDFFSWLTIQLMNGRVV